jgi:proteic killer suppression protein
MRFHFSSRKMLLLYEEEKGAKKFDEGVIDAFFEVMAIIRDAPDERTLYDLKSLHFEKLKGKRSHERSLRLNKQWRLIVEIRKDDEGAFLLVKEIEDYH